LKILESYCCAQAFGFLFQFQPGNGALLFDPELFLVSIGKSDLDKTCHNLFDTFERIVAHRVDVDESPKSCLEFLI